MIGAPVQGGGWVMVGGVRVLRVVEAHEFVTGVLAANGDRPVARAAD